MLATPFLCIMQYQSSTDCLLKFHLVSFLVVVKNYAVARVTVPLVGQVTDKVARSPTVDAKG